MRALFAFLLLVGIALGQPCPNGQCPQPSWQSRTPQRQSSLQYSQAPGAVVRIWHTQGGSSSGGTGTLVAPDLIVTCAHLFDGQGTTRIIFANGYETTGELLAVDTVHDLAAVRISPVKTQPVAIAADYPKRGERVYSAGYGGSGDRYAVNAGSTDGYVVARNQPGPETLTISGMARQGDSGGPMLNEQGELVGVIFGTDGATVYGTCCTRIDRFLSRWRKHNLDRRQDNLDRAQGNWQRRNQPQSQMPIVRPPVAQQAPQAIDDDYAAPPADETQACQECDELKKQLAELRQQRDEYQSKADALQRQLESLRNAPPKTVEKIVEKPVEVEKIIEREKIVEAAGSWFSGKAIAVAAGFGVPGWAAAVALWVAKRRIGKRLAKSESGSLVSDLKARIGTLTGRLFTVEKENTRLQTTVVSGNDCTECEARSKELERQLDEALDRNTELQQQLAAKPSVTERYHNYTATVPDTTEARAWAKAVQVYTEKYPGANAHLAAVGRLKNLILAGEPIQMQF